MSLVTPLVKPLTDSQVKPLVNNDAAIYAARAALVEKWPFKNSLIGKNSTPATFTRASAEIYENVFGQYQKYATDVAAYGVGITQHPAITNKCANNNLNPTDGTGVTDGTNVITTAITPSEYPYKLQKLVDDGDANGNVYQSVNSDASTQRSVTVTGLTSGAGTASIKVWVRVTSGTGGDIRLTGGLGSVAFTSTEWVEVKSENITTGGAINFLVRLDPLTTVEWIANHLTETTTAPKQLIECAGASGTLAQTDTQLPTFADNYVDYSEDLSQWTGSGGASEADGVVTFDALAASKLQENAFAGGAAAGITLYIYVRAKAGTLSSFRIGLVDSVGSTLSSDLSLTSDFAWYSTSRLINAGATSLDADIRNATAGTAGTIEVDKVIVSTSPILPKYLETSGSPKIYEMGNMIDDSEDIGITGWAKNGTGTATQDQIAPDGRTKAVTLDDTDAASNTYWYDIVTVSDDTETRIGAVYIKKTTGIPTHYPIVRMVYQTGGTTKSGWATIDTQAGTVSANNGLDSAEVSDVGNYWRVVISLANNGTGNTALWLYCYPAFNTDGGISGAPSTLGSNVFWGAQIIDYDVDTTDYLPTWGSARKLRYNQFLENNCSYFFYLPRGIIEGDSQIIFACEFDSLNLIRVFYLSGSNVIRVFKRVAGSSITFDATYTPSSDGLYGILTLNSTSGMALSLSNGETGSDPDTDSLVLGSTLQLSARADLAAALEGEQAEFSVFNEIVTLEGARRA